MKRLEDLSWSYDWPEQKEISSYRGYDRETKPAFTEANFDFLLKNYSELVERVNFLSEKLGIIEE